MLCSSFFFHRRSCKFYLILSGVSTVCFIIYALSVSLDGRENSFAGGDGRAPSRRRARESESAPQKCVQPKLILWHPDLAEYFTDPAPLRCSETEENWIYTSNGTFRISGKAIRKHGAITCIYIPIKRGNDDFEITRQTPIKPMNDGDPLRSDVFEVKCVGADGSVHTNIYLGVAPNDDVKHRKSTSVPSEKSLGLDILMFGFDSVSRMTWMRNLPKSHDYFVNTLGGVVMEGYNIVGDGTPQALLPILTGKTEYELPEARRGFAGADTVDKHPWIWHDLKKAGYATQWGEDSASIGTFTYRMMGFQDQPVDNYMRTFYLAAERNFHKHQPFCVRSLPRHLNMMNWMKEFLDVYAGQRKFSFNFHSEFTHDGYSELKLADDDLKEFLVHLKTSGHLDNALLILMSDHGARFQKVRNSEQGKYEERMPYFGVRIPPSLEKRFPETMRNLRINANRLTTPFDVHATFRDLLEYDTSTRRGDLHQRGISLLKEVPLKRSCADAGIEPHWCSCLSWTDVTSNDEHVTRAALEVIKVINDMTSSERSLCAELSLRGVSKAVKFSANENVLRFRQSSDLHGRVPDLTDDMDISEVLYQVTLTTNPSDALYEGTVKYLVREKRYVITSKDISRINIYGRQPHCVMERLPHLRPYCYCKHQLAASTTAVQG